MPGRPLSWHRCGAPRQCPALHVVVFVLALAPAALGAEYHLGYEAEHVTALWRRPKRSSRGGRVQVEVGVHTQRVLNMTTPLQDMTSEYTGVIGVGTAADGGAQFQAHVVFDTGSTNLWVASVLCKAPPCTEKTSSRFYDPSKSVTQESYRVAGRPSGRDIDIMFGTGELRGPLHVDTYRVGPMVVHKQPFAMIREMNGEVFSSFPFEGILGLAFRSLSFGGIDPFFERVIEQKLLKSNEFAFFLNTDSSQPSALLWGGIDKDLFEGPIRMFPVVQAHYWALELLDFRLGATSLVPKSDGQRTRRLLVDSGTTYFTVPSDMYLDVVTQIPAAPCRDVAGYPSLVYVLRSADNETFELEVSQQTYMVGEEEGACRPAFMELDVNRKYGPALILGEVFMRHFFTVFSRGDGSLEQARVGFARAKRGALPKVATQTPALLQNDGKPPPAGQVGQLMRRNPL